MTQLCCSRLVGHSQSSPLVKHQGVQFVCYILICNIDYLDHYIMSTLMSKHPATVSVACIWLPFCDLDNKSRKTNEIITIEQTMMTSTCRAIPGCKAKDTNFISCRIIRNGTIHHGKRWQYHLCIINDYATCLCRGRCLDRCVYLSIHSLVQSWHQPWSRERHWTAERGVLG